MTPNTAMVLAAGRGERLRPLPDNAPKPLVAVAGKALLDHALDRLATAGVGCAVVNVWYQAERVERHLVGRERPTIVVSREDDLLDTGGGVAHALAELGGEPFYVVNADALWRDAGEGALERLATAWNEAAMDALLLLVATARAVGYEGVGDFHLGARGGLRRRRANETAPFVFAGVQILHRRLFDGCPKGAFSLNLLYDRAQAAGRLYGLVHEGDWLHVGTPAGLAEAERRLGAATEPID